MGEELTEHPAVFRINRTATPEPPAEVCPTPQHHCLVGQYHLASSSLWLPGGCVSSPAPLLWPILFPSCVPLSGGSNPRASRFPGFRRVCISTPAQSGLLFHSTLSISTSPPQQSILDPAHTKPSLLLLSHLKELLTSGSGHLFEMGTGRGAYLTVSKFLSHPQHSQHSLSIPKS